MRLMTLVSVSLFDVAVSVLILCTRRNPSFLMASKLNQHDI